jgi:ATP-dependent Lon protease
MADMEKQQLLTKEEIRESEAIPLIPLRDTVVFPRITLPIAVRRPKSLKALEAAVSRDRLLVFAAQKEQGREDIGPDDIHKVGALVRIRETTRQGDRTMRVLYDGVSRVRIKGFASSSPCLMAEVERMDDPGHERNEKLEALTYSLLNQFRRAVNMGASVPFDVMLVILNMTDPCLLSDLIAANLDFSVDEKQAVLEAAAAEAKLEAASKAVGRLIRLLQVASKIQADTGREIDKMQKEMFLREQIKSIEKELEGLGNRAEADDLKVKLDSAPLPSEVREKAMKEYGRLKLMPSFSPESSYLRTWLEWLTDLPWKPEPERPIDIGRAKRILDRDHCGLDKVKGRILECLAVRKLAPNSRGPILCFVGPPGTGKTSLGKSIAEALGRKFHRVSLGGIRDEAEIRGHRRTYVGALPGRIIQGIAAAKSMNPVFMLDEIDKVGADFRGDPSAALLEALDPEQNRRFSDHYLEAPFDLSGVMFVTTANTMETVPPALRDRLEVIEFPGYTEEEKVRIAARHLIPKALTENGLVGRGLGFDAATVRKLIRRYTSEAGVRNLERAVNGVFRKLARRLAEGKRLPRRIRPGDLGDMLGPEKYSDEEAEKRDAVGAATGLAWTEAGGDILQIEAAAVPGSGKLTLTGNMGKVMQESAQAALSWVRSRASDFKVNHEIFIKSDIHLHVPSGAVPKDGPSAGVAMAMSMLSSVTGRKIKRGVGVTGEISLRGRVLEVGGIKEKVLAARRSGLKTVVMPEKNRKDLVDVPKEARSKMKFIFVNDADEVLKAVMV